MTFVIACQLQAAACQNESHILAAWEREASSLDVETVLKEAEMDRRTPAVVDRHIGRNRPLGDERLGGRLDPGRRGTPTGADEAGEPYRDDRDTRGLQRNRGPRAITARRSP